MSRVAREMRDEERRETARMTPAERVALALALGERDLDLFCRASGLDRAEAERRMDAARRVGRRPSRCRDERP